MTPAELAAGVPDEAVERLPNNMRTLGILEAVARAGAPVTPTEINAEMGLPKPTIHRLFASLEEEGFLRREMEGRHYSPGPRMNRMAAGTIAAVRLRGARLAVMEGLARRIGETVNVAQPDGSAMIYIDRVETHWPLRIQLPIGTRVPLHATASGKCYLASLEPVRAERYIRNLELEAYTNDTITDPQRLRQEVALTRERGHATDNGEFMAEMIAVAVPVAADNGHLFATLSFHAPVLRMSMDAGLQHAATLREAAGELRDIVCATVATPASVER